MPVPLRLLTGVFDPSNTSSWFQYGGPTALAVVVAVAFLRDWVISGIQHRRELENLRALYEEALTQERLRAEAADRARDAAVQERDRIKDSMIDKVVPAMVETSRVLALWMERRDLPRGR